MNNARSRMFALGRMRKGSMNKTEQAYAKELDSLRQGNKIEAYWFEGIKLRLADNTFYSPDFLVMRLDGQLECHEVKGFWMDDARVKIKCAAERFPFKFIAIKRKRGAWEVEEI